MMNSRITVVEIWMNFNCSPVVWHPASKGLTLGWVPFCSSKQHINHGIIPWMPKLSFVHIIVLASRWLADSVNKCLLIFETPEGTEPEITWAWTAPLRDFPCQHKLELVRAYGIWSPSGKRRWSKMSIDMTESREDAVPDHQDQTHKSHYFVFKSEHIQMF